MKNSIKIFVSADSLVAEVKPVLKKITATGVKATVELYPFEGVLEIAQNSTSDQYVNDLICCVVDSADVDTICAADQNPNFGNCVLMSSNATLETYRKAISVGFLEYTTVQEFVSDPSLVLEKFLEQRRGSCMAIAVTGVGGGSGASSVAQLLAGTLSRDSTVRSGLVDLDQFYGRIRSDLGKEGYQSFVQSLAGHAYKRNLNEYFKTTDSLDVFGSDFKVDFDALGDLENEIDFINHLKTIYDYILLDIPTRLAGLSPDILMGVDKLVAVAKPDLSGIRNLNNLLGWLSANYSLPTTVLFNFVSETGLSKEELRQLFPDYDVCFFSQNDKMFEYQKRIVFEDEPDMPNDPVLTSKILGASVRETSSEISKNIFQKMLFWQR